MSATRLSEAHAAIDLDEPIDLRDRKAEHIRLALDRRMQFDSHPFDAWRFGHEALPELDWDEMDLSTEFLGRKLAAPILISCMTGGTEIAGRINRHLAIAAEATGVAVGVGSQRKALEDPARAETFRVRDLAPSVPLLANLGAVQLNYGIGLDGCRRAVDMIGADALVFGGGIGEHAPAIRARICEGMGWCGLRLDRSRNEAAVQVAPGEAVRISDASAPMLASRATAMTTASGPNPTSRITRLTAIHPAISNTIQARISSPDGRVAVAWPNDPSGSAVARW